jgi:hypothetical protein
MAVAYRRELKTWFKASLTTFDAARSVLGQQVISN